jgi:sugar/nucleoside kinase (ribokinase family)
VTFDYVTVGHVTVDVLRDRPAGAAAAPLDSRREADTADGLRQPGGGAFYSALQAARLGLRALILTRGAPRELEALLAPYAAELRIEIAPAERTTTLGTRGAGHERAQRLLAWAGSFEEPVVVDTAILHLAPIARETPRSWRGRADFVGLTPQGLVRAWDARGAIAAGPLERARLPRECDAIVFSATERASCAELIPRSASGAAARPGAERSAETGPVVAVTAGPHPTTILRAGRAPLEVQVPAIARPRDDLGAGDVFAAAFFVALHEGRSPAEAAAFGNAAAAVRLEGVGPDAIGDRRAIERRLGGAPASDEPPPRDAAAGERSAGG